MVLRLYYFVGWNPWEHCNGDNLLQALCILQAIRRLNLNQFTTTTDCIKRQLLKNKRLSAQVLKYFYFKYMILSLWEVFSQLEIKELRFCWRYGLLARCILEKLGRVRYSGDK